MKAILHLKAVAQKTSISKLEAHEQATGNFLRHTANLRSYIYLPASEPR